MLTLAPSPEAYQLVSDLVTPSPRHSIKHIDNLAELYALWSIDQSAYEDCSISFEVFSRWWTRYESGNTTVVSHGEIISSIGIWPLTESQYQEFVQGRLAEKDLLPVTTEICEVTPQQCWYFSGLVVRDASWKRIALVELLKIALGSWVSSNHLSYPAKFCALGYSPEGERMLEKFGFSQTKAGSEMIDGCPVYEITVGSLQVVLKLLRDRGL